MYKTLRLGNKACVGYVPAIGAPSDALVIQKSALQIVDGLRIPLGRTRAALRVTGDDRIRTRGADVDPLRRHPTRKHAHHCLHNLNARGKKKKKTRKWPTRAPVKKRKRHTIPSEVGMENQSERCDHRTKNNTQHKKNRTKKEINIGKKTL